MALTTNATADPSRQFYQRFDPSTDQTVQLPLWPLPNQVPFCGTVTSINGNEAVLAMEDPRYTGHLKFSPLLDKLFVGAALREL